MAILKQCYKEAKRLLKENRELLDLLADHLIEKETITGKEFMEIYRREKGIPEPVEEAKEGETKGTVIDVTVGDGTFISAPEADLEEAKENTVEVEVVSEPVEVTVNEINVTDSEETDKNDNE